jgi:hypothetical protein
LSLVTDFKSVSHCLFSFWIARLLQRHAGYRLLILLYLLNVLLQFGDAAVTAERLQLRNGSPQLVQRVERLSASHREMLADNTKAMRDFERSAAIAAVVLPPDVLPSCSNSEPISEAKSKASSIGLMLTVRPCKRLGRI